MKRLLGFILLGLVALSFYSCELFDEDDTGSQSAIVYITHYYTGRRAPDWERIQVPSIYLWGQICSNPYPMIHYFQVCDKQFSNLENFFEEAGTVYFDTNDRIWEDSIPEPKFNPIKIKISTDIGEISGSITVPDTIETLTVSQHDTVALGTPVTISWIGSDADFYYVYWEHTWVTEDGYGMLMYSRDTLIQGISVTLSGSKFTLNGFIEAIEVFPMNGSFPEVGTEANMDGDGFGYIYLENKSKTSDGQIVFGGGIPEEWWEWLKKPATATSTPKDHSEKIQQKIRIRLGL